MPFPIAGAFAALVGDAMMMLGEPVPADDWHRLADAVGDRRVPPPEVEQLDVAPAEVFGVASFYSSFSFSPASPRVRRVCEDLACILHGPVDRNTGEPLGRRRT